MASKFDPADHYSEKTQRVYEAADLSRDPGGLHRGAWAAELRHRAGGLEVAGLHVAGQAPSHHLPVAKANVGLWPTTLQWDDA